MTAPIWATDLMARVLRDEGADFDVELTWRRARPRRAPKGTRYYLRDGSIVDRLPRVTHSSGISYGNHPRSAPGAQRRIVVTAGSNRVDQRYTLLHEIAHQLAPVDAHHDARFWAVLLPLCARYGVPAAYTRKMFGARAAGRAVWAAAAKGSNR